jgi:asparagine synthase (glutamine-hydrolysing)
VCGINGIFAFHYAANPIDGAELARTRDHMAARGPDGMGEWIAPDRRIGFGHRRLSIIDLSPAGAQPMVSADGKLVVYRRGSIIVSRAQLGAPDVPQPIRTEVLPHSMPRR